MRGRPSRRSSQTRWRAKAIVVEDEAAGFMRHEFAPVLLRGRFNGRFHDLEILGAIAIGQDEEAVAAFGQFVYCIPGSRATTSFGSAAGPSSREGDIRSCRVVDVDIDEIVEPRAADAHEHAGSVSSRRAVGRLRLAEDVMEDFGRAVVFV